MKSITVDINTESSVELTGQLQYREQLSYIIQKCSAQPYSFINTVNDEVMINQILTVAEEKKDLQPSLLFVIGIGGSNLGTLALQQALLGCYYNQLSDGLKIYYVDTLDPDYIHSLTTIAESALMLGKKILLHVVSKSGTTTETAVNLEIFLALLKKYYPNSFANYIVATTDKDSELWQLAKQEQWATLTIPDQLGGRYSVFSAVGLFPLAMLNINITALIQGARHANHICLTDNPQNGAALSAAWHYALLQKQYMVENLFLFSSQLSGVGLWWRQLVAESLGKATTLANNNNTHATLPIVSIGPTDLHSIGQLYLADAIAIRTTFITFSKYKNSVIIPHETSSTLVKNIYYKSNAHIMTALFHGIQQAYTHKELPYRTLLLPELDSYYLGQLLQHYMFEIVYLASLSDINPFDQPAVELYKSATRKILLQ